MQAASPGNPSLDSPRGHALGWRVADHNTATGGQILINCHLEWRLVTSGTFKERTGQSETSPFFSVCLHGTLDEKSDDCLTLRAIFSLPGHVSKGLAVAGEPFLWTLVETWETRANGLDFQLGHIVSETKKLECN